MHSSAYGTFSRSPLNIRYIIKAMAIFDGLIEENMQESELEQWHKAVLPLHTNLAATYMALRDYNKARHHAKQVTHTHHTTPHHTHTHTHTHTIYYHHRGIYEV